jgi:cytoskeletal protein CcmA (bactofilin family)
MQNMRPRTATLALVLTAVAAAGCVRPDRTEVRISHAWPAAGIEQLTVSGTNGRIEIVADPSATEIVMEAHARVNGNLSEKEILEISIQDGVLIVKERESAGRKFRLFGPEKQINFEFRVPGDIRLDARNVNGRIDVDGVDASMDLTTVNGSIEVVTPGGELVARTVNGSVRADFLETFPGAKLKTVNGSVRVRVPRNAQVSPEVRSVNGSFRSDIPVRINAGGDDGRLQVVTVNGSVTLSAFDRVNGLAPPPPAVPEIPEVPSAPSVPEAPQPPGSSSTI